MANVQEANFCDIGLILSQGGKNSAGVLYAGGVFIKNALDLVPSGVAGTVFEGPSIFSSISKERWDGSFISSVT